MNRQPTLRTIDTNGGIAREAIVPPEACEIKHIEVPLDYKVPLSSLQEHNPRGCNSRNSSPSYVKRIKEKILEHNLKKEDLEHNDTWTSCCMRVDRRAAQYFTQMFIIVGVMTFSIAQLVRLDDCKSQPYMGLLTMLIGLVLPSPVIKKGDPRDSTS